MVVSVGIFQTINAMKHFSMYLLAFLISSLVMFLFKSFDHFFFSAGLSIFLFG